MSLIIITFTNWTSNNFLIFLISACESEPVELTEAEGNFTSPGWPGWYYRNQRCSWHITVKEGSRVELLVDIDWFNGDYIYVRLPYKYIIVIQVTFPTSTLIIHEVISN